MFRNLRAEMSRSGIRVPQIAQELGVRKATIYDKLNGHYPFTLDEALQIKRTFFPDCSLEYLFENDKNKSA